MVSIVREIQLSEDVNAIANAIKDERTSFHNLVANVQTIAETLASPKRDETYPLRITNPMPGRAHVCPKCGNETNFFVRAVVEQDWTVSGDGTYIGMANLCANVNHYPNDEDIWECTGCHFAAKGSEFIL